jgi:hypothetical protein
MRASDTSVAIAQVAAKVNTIAQARAALGVVTGTLAQAYSRLDDLTSLAGLRDEARSRLDAVNRFAQRTYAIWTDDPELQEEEISAVNATKVGICLAQANDALKDVEELANEDFWDFAGLLREAIANAAKLAGDAIQSVTNAVAAGGAAFLASAWPTLLLLGAAAVGLYLVRDKVLA